MGLRIHAIPLLHSVRPLLPEKPVCYMIGTQRCSFTYKELFRRYPSYRDRIKEKIGDINGLCDPKTVFQVLNLGQVKTVDINERADISIDLTRPIPIKYIETADLVFEIGTLEHIFDVKAAVENINRLLKKGGIIMHMSPVSFYQHGYYNFNPSFFDSLYLSSGYETIFRTMNVTIYNPFYVIDTVKLPSLPRYFFSVVNKIFHNNAVIYRYNLPLSSGRNRWVLSFFNFWTSHFRISKNLMYCCAHRKLSSELKIPYDVWA